MSSATHSARRLTIPFERPNFVNPADIGGSVAPNPFMPMIRGRTLVYESPTKPLWLP